MLGVVLPGFVVGPLLALVFGIYWPIFRVGGYEPGVLSFLVLPVITLALPVAAYVARLMRNSLEEVLRANFIRTARAKGLAARDVFLRHALRPALIPVVSYLGSRRGFRGHGLAGGRIRVRPARVRPLPHPGRRRSRLSHWSWE